MTSSKTLVSSDDKHPCRIDTNSNFVFVPFLIKLNVLVINCYSVVSTIENPGN